jgi:hypothetical protein
MPFNTFYSNGPLLTSARPTEGVEISNPTSSVTKLGREVRLKAQKILAQRRRTESNENWADTHAPKEFSFEDQRHRLRLLLIEAIRHHSERRNKTLLLKVFKAIERKNPSDGLSKLGVSPSEIDAYLSPSAANHPVATVAQPSPSVLNPLEKAILRNMFQDIDFIMETHENGDRLAARALEQFRLWEQ